MSAVLLSCACLLAGFVLGVAFNARPQRPPSEEPSAVPAHQCPPAAFGALGDPLLHCPALMLGSFHKTHREFFEGGELTKNYDHGFEATVTCFTHKATGRTYMFAIAQVPDFPEGL